MRVHFRVQPAAHLPRLVNVSESTRDRTRAENPDDQLQDSHPLIANLESWIRNCQSDSSSDKNHESEVNVPEPPPFQYLFEVRGGKPICFQVLAFTQPVLKEREKTEDNVVMAAEERGCEGRIADAHGKELIR